MPSPFQLAHRTQRMNPSVVRELLKLTEQPGVLTLAGGLPAPDLFPVEAVRVAAERVLRDEPHAALQYAASEGLGPLREWVAQHLAAQGLRVSPSQVLITHGSQQGLDLVGKVLIDAGVPVCVESPTYLGALQAFAPYEPSFVDMPCDAEGPLPAGLQAGARMAYVLPNFQNPTGRTIGEARRQALVEQAERAGVPLLEDDPYGELWFDAPPPRPLAARWPEGVVYLGSFSKVLAPGLRLGYVVAPKALYPKLLQAKQAVDLHTSGFTQRIVMSLLNSNFDMASHLQAVRARYRLQRDAMAAALDRHMPPGCSWALPRGGMFFWLQVPAGVDATALLPEAVRQGVAYVPGAAFYAGGAHANTMRLSFVTLGCDAIEESVVRLARALNNALGRV